MRTSVSHPLQIATIVSGASRFGRVGVTFCPGKYDPHGMSGAWDRDLALDLDAIRNWGASAIVTLLEPEELTLLRVERLGEEVLRRKMLWFHLPIVDVSIPDHRFEEKWGTAGEELRSILRNGSDVSSASYVERPRPASAFFRHFIQQERCGHMSGLSARS